MKINKEKELCNKYPSYEDTTFIDENGKLVEEFADAPNAEKLLHLALWCENENLHELMDTLIDIAYDVEVSK